MVTRIYPTNPATPQEHPDSPGGWGAIDPTRAESDCDRDFSHLPLPSESPAPGGQQFGSGEDLRSFSFLPLEPLKHYPALSSRRPRLHPRNSVSEIRKPVIYLKCLLSKNIERAVLNRPTGNGRWVWDVSVKRDFAENMVWDKTSFHGFSYSEEYVAENEDDAWPKFSIGHMNITS